MREIFVNADHPRNGTVRNDCRAFWISEGATKRLPLITSRTAYDALMQAVETAAREAGPGLIVVCCKPLVNERTQERLAPYKCRVTWKNKLEFLIAARRAKSLTDTQDEDIQDKCLVCGTVIPPGPDFCSAVCEERALKAEVQR